MINKNKFKKVLVFHPALAPYRIDFFNRLSENFDSKFYFEHRNLKDQKFNQQKLISLCNFRLNYLDKGIEFLNRSFKFGFSLALFKEKPDLVLCSEYGYGTIITFLYKKLFFKKYKIFVMSDDSVDNSKNRNGSRKTLRNYISKRVDGIIFASYEVCDWYKNNIDKSKKLLVLPIIHNDKVFRQKISKSLNKAKENFTEFNLVGKKLILFVGRLVEVKNIDLLIKAFSKIDTSDCVLVIVGDGESYNRLSQLVNQLNISEKTIFTGRKEGSELYSWFSMSQLFVLPSTYEPFGAVVNEALLSGCEVLCSEKAGASSLINDQNGLVFDPYSADDLSRKLKLKLNNIIPLCINDIKLRNNNMRFHFDDKLEILVKNLF